MSRSRAASIFGSLVSRLQRRSDPGHFRGGLWVLAIAAIVLVAELVRGFPVNPDWLEQLEQVARILTPIAIGMSYCPKLWIGGRAAGLDPPPPFTEKGEDNAEAKDPRTNPRRRVEAA